MNKMKSTLHILILIGFALIFSCSKPGTESVFPVCPEDRKAVYIESYHGTDKLMDSGILQQAINQVEKEHEFGIVFIPSGTYYIDETIYVWRGIRLIGYGSSRPVFVLPESTKGYQEPSVKYCFHFCDAKPDTGESIVDAKNTTFYSGMNNINILIESGNDSAAAVRFNVAQLSSLENMNFILKSGKTAVHQIGNEIENCRFIGGDYGILTHRTSAGWQFLLLNCEFQDQSQSAIRTKEAGMTIMGCCFENTPKVVEIEPEGYEELYVQDCSLKDINKTAFVIQNGLDPKNQINMKDVRCEHVSEFCELLKPDEILSSEASKYHVSEFIYGMDVSQPITKHKKSFIKQDDDASQLKSYHYETSSPKTWVNVLSLGVKGDGKEDDTQAIKEAIQNHNVLYFPMGKYRINDTIILKSETELIGLHPAKTLFILTDHTPGFNSSAQLKAMILAPDSGQNKISGLGFDPGYNKGAIQIQWQAGADSYMNDVWFSWGGHGDHRKGVDVKQSLLVDGGGGIFKNIWSANIFTETGLTVQNTDVPGQVFLMSVEHHKDKEVYFNNVQNWEFYALQTEENYGSQNAMAIDMVNCSDLRFVNLFLYRVMSHVQSFPFGVRITGCNQIVIQGMHNFSWGKYPFAHSIRIIDEDRWILDKEFTYFELKK